MNIESLIGNSLLIMLRVTVDQAVFLENQIILSLICAYMLGIFLLKVNKQ